MSFFSDEGIIAGVAPFQERDRLVHLFSLKRGLIRILIKGIKKNAPFPDALSRIQCVYRLPEGDRLAICREWTLLEPFYALRDRHESLSHAISALKIIKATQVADNPAPPLYHTLCRFLRAMETAPHPATLGHVFRLKTWKFEGTLAAEPHCISCQAPLTARFYAGPDPYCPSHRPAGALLFSAEEGALLDTLLDATSLTDLSQTSLPDPFAAKLIQLTDNV